MKAPETRTAIEGRLLIRTFLPNVKDEPRRANDRGTSLARKATEQRPVAALALATCSVIGKVARYTLEEGRGRAGIDFAATTSLPIRTSEEPTMIAGGFFPRPF